MDCATLAVSSKYIITFFKVDDGWGAFTITSITAVDSCCALKEKRSFILFNVSLFVV